MPTLCRTDLSSSPIGFVRPLGTVIQGVAANANCPDKASWENLARAISLGETYPILCRGDLVRQKKTAICSESLQDHILK